MMQEGEEAPVFELPAVVDGEIEPLSLEDYLGRQVVILAFYPGDFNPACGEGTTGLDDLDLFTMQKDVAVLGLSADSVYSHRAFADAYDLSVALLSDARAEVASTYGATVEADDAGYLTSRAVFVVSPAGQVVFAWSAADLESEPPITRIREAVGAVTASETAAARYRVGHAHYVEGRRAFTSAMDAFEDEDWTIAEGDFRRADEEFTAAADLFDTAVRFGEGDREVAYFELAEAKAELLWQAAEWLADAAAAHASGEGGEGRTRRDEAEDSLEAASDYPEPPEPDGFPPDDPPDIPADADVTVGDPDRDEKAPAGRDGVGAASDANGDQAGRDGAADDGWAGHDGWVDGETAAEAGAGADESADAGTAASAERATGIDEAELEEITAELEQQTDRTAAEGAGGKTDADRDGGDDRSRGDDETDAGAELDLTDPTDGEELEPLEDSEDEDQDLGDGDHGVPDSL